MDWRLSAVVLCVACGPTTTPPATGGSGSSSTGSTTTTVASIDGTSTTSPADSTTGTTGTTSTGGSPMPMCRSDADCRDEQECDTDVDDCVDTPHCDTNGLCRECFVDEHCPEGWSCSLTACEPFVEPLPCRGPEVTQTLTGLVDVDEFDFIDLDDDGDEELVGFRNDELLVVRLDDGSSVVTHLDDGMSWTTMGVGHLTPGPAAHVVLIGFNAGTWVMVGEFQADGTILWQPPLDAEWGMIPHGRVLGMDLDDDGVDSIVARQPSNSRVYVLHDPLGPTPTWLVSDDQVSGTELRAGRFDAVPGPDIFVGGEDGALLLAGSTLELLTTVEPVLDSVFDWLVIDTGGARDDILQVAAYIHRYVDGEPEPRSVRSLESAPWSVAALDFGEPGNPRLLLHGGSDVGLYWNFADFPDGVCHASLENVDGPTNTLRVGDVDGDGIDEFATEANDVVMLHAFQMP